LHPSYNYHMNFYGSIDKIVMMSIAPKKHKSGAAGPAGWPAPAG